MNQDQHLDETSKPLEFLARLEADPGLRARCERTGLAGRLEIANRLGLCFSEENFRRTVRCWDMVGRWHKWLEPGRIADTADDLPALASPFPVTEDDRATYQREGYVVLRQVMTSDEIAACRPVFDSAIAHFDVQTPSRTDDPSRRAFIQVINMRHRGEALRHIVLAQRFAKIAADLMGAPAVRVYFDQLLYKEPRSMASHAHQDHTYFPLDTDQVITIWIPLVEVTEDMGPLVYAPGSHLPGNLGFKPDYDDARTDLPAFVRERGYDWRTTGPMAAGDVTLHDGWVIHGALPNRSRRMREAVSVTYYAQGARLAAPANPYQRRALAFMYPGKRPGELAESDATPVAYTGGGP